MSRPAWSFSSVEQYRNCPKQYQEVRIFKNWKEAETEERRWGNRVHDALQAAMQHGTPLPAGMEVWQHLANQFRGVRGTLIAEQQLAINESWQPCGWFAKDCWLRVIIDAAWVCGRVIKMVDWKTGKPKHGSDQLALFALVLFMHYPEVDEVRTGFVWLKNGTMTQEKWMRADIPKIWNLYSADIMRLENAHANEVFPARTSGLCRAWCPVLTCQFNGKSQHSRGK